MRLADTFRDPILRPQVSDQDFVLRSCGTEQRLNVMVGAHHLNGYLIGSKVDIVLRAPESSEDEVLIPATPNFFSQYRYL